MDQITLGSKSPRRLELLKRLNLNIIVKPSNIDETFNKNKTLEENGLDISNKKLLEIRTRNPNDKWIVTADTFIAFRGIALGKPRDREDAFDMLQTLAGNEHKVITALSLYSKKAEKTLSEVDISYVKFKDLSTNEINSYLDLNEWEDAAGGYKIQAQGEILTEYIKGTFSSIMGLPINRFYGMLTALNYY
ncbi:MAG: septum formation protein Maf [Spirochaetaceae bacterium 4572_7]|nr:MAG: septum formation protein Maf [Spirochaetaceae bacterium 4572_7]